MLRSLHFFREGETTKFIEKQKFNALTLLPLDKNENFLYKS